MQSSAVVALNILTLGIGAIWSTQKRLSRDHEVIDNRYIITFVISFQAFVAWGKSPDSAMRGDIIFIAEFGEGDIIRRPNFLRYSQMGWDGDTSKEVIFTGQVALNVR